MRQFWANQLDFNDRNDFPAASRNNPGNPRPTGRAGQRVRVRRRPRHRNQHGRPGQLPGPGDRRRRAAALRHLGRAAALLLRELVAVQRERRGVPPHRRRLQGQQLQLRGAGEGVLLVAAGHRRGRHRQLPPSARSRSASPAATTCARRCRTGWASPTCACRRSRCPATRRRTTNTHRGQRRGRRVQPRRAGAGDAVGADDVLPRRHRDAVREHRQAGGRRHRRARSTSAATSRARSTGWWRPSWATRPATRCTRRRRRS